MFEIICFNCGSPSHNKYPLCESCKPLVLDLKAVCSVCGIPTSTFVKVCPTCINNQFNFISNRSLFYYKGISKEILTQYKFKKDKSFTNFYSSLISNYLLEKFTNPIISIIPTSKIKRKLKNGYQLDSIERDLKRSGFDVRTLLSKKFSKTQKKLNRLERENNLVSSFKLKGDIPRDSTIVLIDDVFTTGATIDACAMLLNVNRNSIYSITLYRD